VAVFLSFKKFRARQLLITVINTGMGFPPVFVGLIVYIFLTRNGPFGFLDLIYTPWAMILAQYILATPIITGVAFSAIRGVEKVIGDTALTLGASRLDMAWLVVKEARFGIITAILAGFGRAIAEVGAILIVGGNIALTKILPSGEIVEVSYTRTLTTAITVETRMGELASALALGIILICLAFVVNLITNAFSRGRYNERSYI
jgi:tungstate transport system permease protein